MIKFDADTHTYSKDGDVYISATQLLSKFKLGADYDNIPAKILDAAAKRGKKVHEDIEMFLKGLTSPPGTNSIVDQINTYIQLQNIDMASILSEEAYYNDEYQIAGTVDFQYRLPDGSLVIADFKTTSQLHIDAVAWQLSIYNYLISQGDIMSYYFNKQQVFHIKDGNVKSRFVETIDYDEVKALFEANKNGTDFVYVENTDPYISDSQLVLLDQILNEETVYKEALNKLDTEKRKLLIDVKEKMEKRNKYTVSSPNVKITYVPGATTTSYNSKAMLKRLTELGESPLNFVNTTTKDAFLKVKRANGTGTDDNEQD